MLVRTSKTCVTSLTSAAVAVAAAEFGGRVVPGDAGLEDGEDAGEHLAVVQGLATGETEAALGWGRQRGPESFPRGIRDQGFHRRCSFGVRGRSPSHRAAAPV